MDKKKIFFDLTQKLSKKFDLVELEFDIADALTFAYSITNNFFVPFSTEYPFGALSSNEYDFGTPIVCADPNQQISIFDEFRDQTDLINETHFLLSFVNKNWSTSQAQAVDLVLKEFIDYHEGLFNFEESQIGYHFNSGKVDGTSAQIDSTILTLEKIRLLKIDRFNRLSGYALFSLQSSDTEKSYFLLKILDYVVYFLPYSSSQMELFLKSILQEVLAGNTSSLSGVITEKLDLLTPIVSEDSFYYWFKTSLKDELQKEKGVIGEAHKDGKSIQLRWNSTMVDESFRSWGWTSISAFLEEIEGNVKNQYEVVLPGFFISPYFLHLKTPTQETLTQLKPLFNSFYNYFSKFLNENAFRDSLQSRDFPCVDFAGFLELWLKEGPPPPLPRPFILPQDKISILAKDFKQNKFKAKKKMSYEVAFTLQDWHILFQTSLSEKHDTYYEVKIESPQKVQARICYNASPIVLPCDGDNIVLRGVLMFLRDLVIASQQDVEFEEETLDEDDEIVKGKLLLSEWLLMAERVYGLPEIDWRHEVNFAAKISEQQMVHNMMSWSPQMIEDFQQELSVYYTFIRTFLDPQFEGRKFDYSLNS